MDLQSRIAEFRRASSATARANVLRQLATEGGPEVESLLMEALQDPAAVVRYTALSVLESRGTYDRDTVVRALGDSSKMVRRLALRLLQRWPDPALLPLVTPFLDDEDLGLRLLAMDWLFVLGEAGLPYLQALQEDTMFSVRIKARHYVRDLRRRFPTSRPAAPPPVPSVPEPPRPTPPTASWRESLERLPIVEGADSRLLIERILQEGGEEAARALIHFLEDPRWNRREVIVQALRSYPHFPSVYLHPLLTHPLWYVRAAAIELLGSFQDPVLLEHATRLAKDPNIEVRRALVGALRHFPFEEDARLVLEVLARDDHFLIRRLARESLIQLRQTSSSVGSEPGLS